MNSPRFGEPAGFASRAVALIADAVLVGVASALVAWTTAQMTTLLLRPSLGDRLTPWFVTIGGVFIAAVYQVASWTAFGRTAGKALLGLAVTTTDGRRPGVLRSLVRLAGYIVSTIPLGLGFAWVLIDDRRRAWHDMMAGTRVVYRPRRGVLMGPPGLAGDPSGGGSVLAGAGGSEDLEHPPQ